MDLSLLCTADQTPSPPALTNSQTGDLHSLCPLQSPTENMLSAYETGAETVSELSDPADKSTETLSNISKSLSQEKSTNSDCLKPLSSSCNMSECLSLCSQLVPNNNECSVSGYFGPSEHVIPLLPHLSHDLIPPICESEFKEPALSFSLIQDNSKPQPFRATSSTSEGLMEPSVTEPLSSGSFSSDHSQATPLLRSLSYQSDSLESDTATAPVSDLYIFESETQDFILSLNVDPEEIKCPEYQSLSQTRGKKADDCDSRVMMCNSENVVTQCHHGSSQERAMLDYESDVSQHKRLIPPAVDACDADMMSVNDAQREKAEVTDLTPQLQRSDSPIEMWLDACQYLAGEDTDDRDVLDKTGQSVMQGVLTVTSDLAFPARETQVSGCNPGGSEGIGWSDDDTRGWGPPVERWSSVDSWASALSDWTGIITALPEDLTAAFTEIGAEIDALRQVLTEVNTHIDTETSRDGKGQKPAVQAQPQQTMGVQDQPLKTQNLPDSSVLSGQSCLSLCLEASGHELQDRKGSLCDSTPTTPREKKPDEIQTSKTELAPCPTHLRTPMVSPSATIASPGGYGVDVIPESTYSADMNLSHFGGYVESFETDIFISNDEDPVILNIIEDTDLEGQKAPAELLIEEVR